MAHAAIIAANAAAAAARARQQVLDTFRTHGATAPDRATSLTAIGVDESDGSFRALMESGVLRAVDARGRPVPVGSGAERVGGYYLDEVAYIAQRDAKPAASKVAFLIMGALLLLTAGAVALVLGAQ